MPATPRRINKAEAASNPTSQLVRPNNAIGININGIPISVTTQESFSLDNVEIYDTAYIGSTIQFSSNYNSYLRNLTIKNSIYQEVDDSESDSDDGFI